MATAPTPATLAKPVQATAQAVQPAKPVIPQTKQEEPKQEVKKEIAGFFNAETEKAILQAEILLEQIVKGSIESKVTKEILKFAIPIQEFSALISLVAGFNKPISTSQDLKQELLYELSEEIRSFVRHNL